MTNKGWRREPTRHSLAAKGVKTKIQFKHKPILRTKYVLAVREENEEFYNPVGGTENRGEATRMLIDAELMGKKKYADIQVVEDGEYEVAGERLEFEVGEDVTADGYGLGEVIEGTRDSKSDEWKLHIKWKNGVNSWLLASKVKGVVEAGRSSPTYEETKSGKYKRQHKWYIKTEDGVIKYV
jgi:hypothetical protein